MKNAGNKIKVISFDVEGTLASPDFSQAVWYEGIPSLYARRNTLSFQDALASVRKAYDEVGDNRKEWYDIKYWFGRFQLGDYQPMLENYKGKATHYPEVQEVLPLLARDYQMIVTSSSSREFLKYLLDGITGYFNRVFSSVSDYGQLKSPQFYMTVCREMKIKPEEMVHIGDSMKFDVTAAQQAGIAAFHIERRQTLQNSNSLASLTELLARLPGR